MSFPGIDVEVREADQPGPDEGCLARFFFGTRDPGTGCNHGLTLDVINTAPQCEEWRVAGHLEHSEEDGLRNTLHAELALLNWTGPVEENVRTQARDVYRRLLQRLQDLDRTHIIKAWNHIPDINLGDGDAERYRQFCLGRAEAFDAALGSDSMPAGTAVGSATGTPLQVIVLAARTPPQAIENPRQMSAYRYPRQYGPRGPSFSRASLVDGRQLFVSGTAAIVGHESQHAGSVEKQIRETVQNWQSLLNAAAEQAGAPPPHLEQVRCFRVYLKEPYCQTIASRVLASAGVDASQVVFLQAAICRRELLFELDGIVDLQAP